MVATEKKDRRDLIMETPRLLKNTLGCKSPMSSRAVILIPRPHALDADLNDRDPDRPKIGAIHSRLEVPGIPLDGNLRGLG